MSLTRDDARMAVHARLRAAGERRSALLRNRSSEDLHRARFVAGLSLRELGDLAGVDRKLLARAERGDPRALTVDLLARVAPFLGHQAAVALYSDGTAVRDAAHLALLKRFRDRLPGLRLDVEVPVPIAGDRRSGDAVARLTGDDVLVEAETRLYDVQEMERRILAKARDLGAIRIVLLVADTAHNRHVIREVPLLRDRFPVGTRAALAALGRGEVPPGDALVIL